jgi:hypothetical protein
VLHLYPAACPLSNEKYNAIVSSLSEVKHGTMDSQLVVVMVHSSRQAVERIITDPLAEQSKWQYVWQTCDCCPVLFGHAMA